VGIVRGPQAAAQRGSPPGQAPRIAPSGPTFYLEPASGILRPGEPFEVELHLDNPENQEFDELQVTFQYDPRLFTLVHGGSGAPDSPGISSAAEELLEQFPFLVQRPDLYQEESDPENGIVRVSLRTPPGQTYPYRDILGRFMVIPQSPAREAYLRLIGEGADGEPASFLRRGGEDILSSPDDPFDGLVTGQYEILDTEEDEEEAFVGDFRTRLHFSPSALEVGLGDMFDVDLVITNPDGVPFDFVTLVLKYDTQKIRVIDADHNNWIKRGINILDGHTGVRFPFTVRDQNVVLPSHGIILYRSGRPEEPLMSEGVLATIRFVAVGPTGPEGTQLLVGYHPFDAAANTGLYYQERDVLGRNDDPKDGVETLRLQIGGPEVTHAR
jgi:hypothetical protein